MKAFAFVVAFALAVPAFAATQYQCYPGKDNDQPDNQMVTILSATKAKFDGSVVTLNPDYKPKGGNSAYRQFLGYRGAFNNDGYSIELYFHKDMLAGKPKASMKMYARGEGFFNYYYYCYRRK